MNVSNNDGASFKKSFFGGSTTDGIVSKLQAATPQNQHRLVGQLLQHFIDHPKDNISDRLNRVNNICPEVLSAALQSTVDANPVNRGPAMTAFRTFLETHPASTSAQTGAPMTISGVAYPPVMLNILQVDDAPTGGSSQLSDRKQFESLILNPNDDDNDLLLGIVGVDDAPTGSASQLSDRKESGSPILNPNDDDNDYLLRRSDESLSPITILHEDVFLDTAESSAPPSYWAIRIGDAVPHFHAKAEAGQLTDFLHQTYTGIMEQLWLETDEITADRISSEVLSEMAKQLGVEIHPGDGANITDALTRMGRDFLVKNHYPPEPTELNNDEQDLLDDLSAQIKAALPADKSQITAGDLAKIHAGLMESVWTTPGVDGVVIEPRLFAVMAENLGVTVALPGEKEMYHHADVFQRMVDAMSR